jgi:hypothetical protein
MKIRKVHGPYERKSGRKFVVIIYKDGTRTTRQYARYLMEQELGRELTKDEEVDHIDRDHTNDEIWNLRVVSKEEHKKDDQKRRIPVEWRCPLCDEKFVLDAKQENDAFQKRKQGKAGPFCSKQCAGRYGAEVRFGKRKAIEVDYEEFVKEHKKLRRIDPRFKER